MKLQCRLRAVLVEHGLDKRGIIGEIAQDVDAHRQTIATLYNCTADVLNLDLLGRIVDWLLDKGVPADRLPDSLIGPGALWDHIRFSNRVNVCMGEYEPADRQKFARSMISRHDAEVSNKIVRAIAFQGRLINMRFSFVPFQYSTDGGIRQCDKDNASEVFSQMRASQRANSSTFLIGSQKINVVTEVLVASCFQCEPFELSEASARIPFFIRYREGDLAMPSCFGGRELPAPIGLKGQPGVYYRDHQGRWQACPYHRDKSDAGIVIVTEDPGANVVEIALLGFSSASTAAIGDLFLKKADDFWPPLARTAGRNLGVYVCRFACAEPPSSSLVCSEIVSLSADPPRARRR